MVIFISVDENNVLTGWGSSKSIDSEVEVELIESHPLFYTHPRLFIYQDGQVILSSELQLSNAKSKKDIELNQACQGAILAGFFHTINEVDYWFSYDKEAQGNFSDAQSLLSDDLVEEIIWTVKQDGVYTRIPITKDIMQELKMVILRHKTGNISKYRDVLMKVVNEAQTVEEVEAVSWNQEI